MPPADIIEHLQSELDKSGADDVWAASTQAWYAARNSETVGALLGLLEDFLSGRMSLKEFQVTFDKETRTTWDIMGLKGMSGAMFLNTLVKYVPDQSAVDSILRAILPKPSTTEDGRTKMASFATAIEGWLAAGVTKTQVQPARIPFFLSAWWQLQEREIWPVYYASMRAVYERLGIWKPGNGSVTGDYFTFRDATLELMRELNLTVWAIERLCLWIDRPASAVVPPSVSSPGLPHTPIANTSEQPAPGTPVGTEPGNSPTVGTILDGTAHTQVQWLLARLGKQLGLKVWIAQNDHQRTWNGEKLGGYSIPALPHLGIGDAAQKVVRLIDVIWIKGFNQVIAAFEVESTTSIFSGLLRMSDLTVLAPNTNFPIYIVSPEAKLERVREQLRRPTFQNLELHQRCRFFSIEQFIAKAPAMLEWMNDPSAMDKIAERIGDVDLDNVLVIDDEDIG